MNDRVESLSSTRLLNYLIFDFSVALFQEALPYSDFTIGNSNVANLLCF